MLLFLCFRYHCAHHREASTVIDSTIQSGIKYQRENWFTYVCLLPQNDASLCFSVCISHQVLAEMPPASGPQAGAQSRKALLPFHPHVYAAGSKISSPISHCQMVTIPPLSTEGTRNILCLNAAHLGHGLCLQTPGEGNLPGSSLTIYFHRRSANRRQAKFVRSLPATELAVLQPRFQWVHREIVCRKPGLERAYLTPPTSFFINTSLTRLGGSGLQILSLVIIM